jgi:drug/metabolite transporter (DMT)-like permease
MQTELLKRYLSLVIAVVAVSWAAIFIRLAEAPPLVSAFYRMAFAVLFLSPFALSPFLSELRVIRKRELSLTILSGILLGVHFAVWFTSLFYTTISNSVVLVTTQPIFVAILSLIFLKEGIRALQLLGIVCAIIGGAFIAGGDLSLGREYLVGDLLALAGALAAGAYMFCGRIVRQRMNLLPYIFSVYLLATLVLGILCILYGESLYPYPKMTFLWFVLLALVPTIVGHTLYNWTLKYLKAHLVATTILGEPVGSTILAFIIFSEVPASWTYIGAILIFAGVFLVFRTERYEPFYGSGEAENEMRVQETK